MHFAGYWNVFVNPDAVGRLRGKLNHWDMPEDVGFRHSSVTGAPYFATDHSELKAHIFLQKFTGMGQQIKTTGLPYQKLSSREYILAVGSVFEHNFLRVQTNVHKNNFILNKSW